MRQLLILLCAAICVMLAPLTHAASAFTFPDDLVPEIFLPKVGVDINSADSVIKALQNEDAWVRKMAVREIGIKRFKEALPAVRAMLAATQDQNYELVGEDVIDYARTLAALDDPLDDWKNACMRLLADSHYLTRLNAADVLVSRGDTRGWPVVRSSLFSRNADEVFRAADIASAFDGKDFVTKTGKEKIDIVAVCAEALTPPDRMVQTRLHGLIANTATPSDLPDLRRLLKAETTPYQNGDLQETMANLEEKERVDASKQTGPADKKPN